MAELKYVGQSPTRVEADEKVAGEAVYGYDLVLPGMLYGKTVFSDRAHACIVEIDTRRAEAYPGVEAVVTGKDVPFIFGETIKDQPFMAIDKVRFVGEPVAAVAAVDEDTAQAAAALIEVTYEDLPAYLSPVEASRPDSVAIHEDFDSYPRADFVTPGELPNVLEHFKLRTGDVEAGLAESDVVIEETYSLPSISHAAMEPHSSHAQVDPETGRITIWSPNDAPFRTREELAAALDRPLDDLRFINPLQGGGFGSKGGLKVEQIALALAMHTDGKPVRVKYSREETFRSTLTRHGAVVTIKSGVKSDGTLHARKMEIYWDGGAYNEKSATVCIRGSQFAPGPYRIPHVWVDAYAVYTNKPVSGAFRGYGVPQGTWACEQHMDELAKRLSIDPLAFRKQNIFSEGEVSYWGEELESVGLEECLDRAAAALEAAAPRTDGVGRGLACMIKPTKASTASEAAVTLDGEGNVTVLAGTVEIGQGCNTIQSQIAAEELDVPLERVTYAPLDTDVTPYDASTTSSRSTYHVGNAVRMAAANLREKLLEFAPLVVGNCEPADLRLQDGTVWLESEPERRCDAAEIVKAAAGSDGVLRGEGECAPGGIELDPETGHSPQAAAYYMYGAQAADVEVDIETGVVTLLRISAAHDVGKAINPVACEGQIEGGAVMGAGAALYETLVYDDRGNIKNPSFLDYHLVTSADAPKLEASIVEEPLVHGPFGAKGVGEPPVALTPAAIGNAVADATGTRIRDLPLRPERVYWAINGSGANGS